MNKQQLQQTIHELATQAVPSNLDLWPAIRERLSHRSHRTLQARPIPVARLGWFGLALAALFVFSITAYAAGPVINRLLHGDERLKHINLALSQPLDLSQTIENVTVTVQWVYADADYVLVGYTIRASDGRRFDPNDETLRDTDDIIFPWQGGYGVTGQSEILQVTLPPGEGTSVSIFNNISALKTLNLHFTVYAQELVLPSVQVTPSPINATTEEGAVQVQLQPMPAGEIIGPFTFDFSIPVGPSDQSR